MTLTSASEHSRGTSPQAPAGDPSMVLLLCTGRVAMADRPRLAEWSWDTSVRGAH